jgi:hypothetical protein
MQLFTEALEPWQSGHDREGLFCNLAIFLELNFFTPVFPCALETVYQFLPVIEVLQPSGK